MRKEALYVENRSPDGVATVQGGAAGVHARWMRSQGIWRCGAADKEGGDNALDPPEEGTALSPPSRAGDRPPSSSLPVDAIIPRKMLLQGR